MFYDQIYPLTMHYTTIEGCLLKTYPNCLIESSKLSAVRFQRLQKLEPKLGCSITEMLNCAGEIESKAEDICLLKC